MAFKAGTISSLCDQLAREGATEGSVNRPDANAASPDLHEVQLITTAKQFISAEEALFADSLVDADRESREITQRIEALDVSCSSHLNHDLVESAFRSSLATNEHELVSSCAAEMEARAALNGFKAKHGIKEPARYPSDRLFHFSLLILFVALETGINAFFYEGSSGLLGGAIIALSVAAVNMGIAAWLGAFFRYSNLPDTKSKLIGYGSMSVFLLTGLFLNLIFATFRIQYQLVQQKAINDGLQEPSTVMMVEAFKNSVVDAFAVFQFNFPSIDFMSLILFFVGIGCSVIAFWKGYTYDDKHPGYGDIDRTHKAVENAFTLAKDRTFKEAEATVRQLADEVENLRNQIVTEQRNVSALKAKAQSSQTSFVNASTVIQSELNLVIETYRAANRATRATTAPAYFSELPNVITSNGADRLMALLINIDKTGQMAKTLADTRASVLGDSIVRIRQQINGLVENEFHKQIESVRQRAEKTIAARGQLGHQRNG
jgi:hypothetical protein